MRDVHIPIISAFDRPRTDGDDDDDALDDWKQEIQIIFEWVGMSCLGAQRYVFLFY